METKKTLSHNGDQAAEELFQVERAEVFGRAIPTGALRLRLSGTKVATGGATYDAESQQWKVRPPSVAKGQQILVVSEGDTYLAQAAKVLALMDDSGAEVWLAHPKRALAFPVKLRDEAAFERWLSEVKPGRARIIQREDGLELQTNMGKLPGLDRRGPTLPVRGGELDIAALRRALAKIKTRFKDADEICIVPSYGTELVKITDVLSGCFESDNLPSFAQLCLVYPRPPGAGQ